jgi:hypothetical protein
MITVIKRQLGVMLTVALSLMFLFYHYGDFVLSPNSFLFNVDGDAIKNYYTFAYHIKHDVSLNHFSGMHFPYGDMHILTDGHPLLAWILQLLTRVYPEIPDYSIGILNSLILWSTVLTSIVLYYLLRSFEVSWVWSAVFAVSIMMLAPQWDRMYGHLSMAYLFFIPLTWLWIKNFCETIKYRYVGYLFVLLLVLYFTHPYMGVISTLFVIIYQSVVFLISKNTRNKYFVISAFVSAILPLIIFQLYVIALDDYESRPLNKYTYGDSFGELKSVFLPHFEPFGTFFRSVLKLKNQTWEAWSYIGLGTGVILLFSFIRTIVFVIKKRKQNWNSDGKVALYTGLVMLIVSIGIPLKYNGDFILEMVPSIRQIRVMSRFSWAFYYVGTVYAVVYIYDNIQRISNRRKKIIISFAVLCAFASLNYYESLAQHKKALAIFNSPNLFNVEDLGDELKRGIESVNAADYQAILSLPFFWIGTEKLAWEISNSKAFKNSLLLSYHTGLPLMDNCLSRSSDSKAEEVMEVLVELYNPSKLLPNLDAEKSILTYVDREMLKGHDLEMLPKLNLVSDFDSYSLHKFIPSQVLVNKREEVLKHYQSIKNKWPKDGCNLYENGEATVLFETFDEYGNEKQKSFRGGNCLGGNFNDYLLIWKAPVSLLKTSKKYFISFWYYSNMEETSNIMFFLSEKSKDGQNEWTNVHNTRMSLRTIGDWTYLKFPFTPKFEDGELSFVLHSKCKLNPRIYLDQFLIWEQDQTVYSTYSGELFKNNYPVSILLD